MIGEILRARIAAPIAFFFYIVSVLPFLDDKGYGIYFTESKMTSFCD